MIRETGVIGIMKWTLYTALLIAVCAFAVFPAFAAQTKQKTPARSGMKIKYTPPASNTGLNISRAKYDFIEQVIRTHVAAGEDINNKDVANAILGDVATEIKFKPTAALDKRSPKDLLDIARQRISKQFPKTLAQYKKELTEQAEKLFIQYKLWDHIKIRYYRGSKIYSVSGIFYSNNRHTVKIGSRVIPYFDVIPEDKIRIDKIVCDEKRAEYIGTRYEDYRQRRSEALMRELEKLKTAQDEANEKAGYISFLDKWYTAAQLTRQKIAIERQKLVSSGAKNAGEGELLVFDIPDEAKLREKIKQKKQEIASLSGIDSDQGYSPAFWGFTRGEARLALKYENHSPMATKAFDYFVTSNRQIRNIQFDYLDNKLTRVITFYTRVNISDYEKLKNQYISLYGPDDLLRTKPKDPANKDRLRSLTWTGKQTTARLLLNLNEDSDIISGVCFIKEKTGAYDKEHTLIKDAETLRKQQEEARKNSRTRQKPVT